MVQLEIFSGDPPCPGCVAIIDLAKRVAEQYTDQVELKIPVGQECMEKFETYKLYCVPAVVVNGTVRIEGMCPSEQTLKTALREGGVTL